VQNLNSDFILESLEQIFFYSDETSVSYALDLTRNAFLGFVQDVSYCKNIKHITVLQIFTFC